MPSKKQCWQFQTVEQTCDSTEYLTRRGVLATSGTAVTGALAGCSALSGEEETPEEYEHLQQRPVYVDEDVELSIPDTVQIVDVPGDADLIVIQDTPDIEVSKAVEWLEEKRAIALLGGEAQSTWLSWVQSDAYEEAFDPQGFAEGDPEPQLLIAWDTGPLVTTQQYNWGTGPSDSDVLTALNKTLRDIDPRTG
ncbi:hypothetical protein [Halomontanus rarus]|uniref:hypothetical protein n=1 Tax=Halomontanus rarus TaxID=3034020 RepID=UPI001F6155D7